VCSAITRMVIVVEGDALLLYSIAQAFRSDGWLGERVDVASQSPTTRSTKRLGRNGGLEIRGGGEGGGSGGEGGRHGC
jgi:hypothetical protein